MKSPQTQTSGQKGGPMGATSDRPTATVSAPINFTSMERIWVTYEANELYSFYLFGQLKMHVDKHVDRQFRIQIERGDDTLELEFEPHKTIQKGKFDQEDIIGLEVPRRPFDSGKTNLLHWSMHLQEESNVPLKLNCQTPVSGNGTHMRVEYGASNIFVLRGVVIRVPLPPLSEPVNVQLEHGDWRHDSEKAVLEWSMPLIDESMPSGAMEFVVHEADDVSKFFPVSVEFRSTTTFSKLKIVRIMPQRKGEAPKFSHKSELVTVTYQVSTNGSII